MANKLPEEILKSLQEKHSTFIDLRAKLADLCIHEMRINDQKQHLRKELELASEDLRNMEKSLQEEHGATNINLSNGEFEK